MNKLNIDIYADGANLNDIKNLNENDLITGFTTNPTLMSAAGIKNYKEFAIEASNIVKNKPISFEVFADDLDEMYKQAKEISTWNKNIVIKIPITNTKKQSTRDIIFKLLNENISINVTAIFTVEQIETYLLNLKNEHDIIFSVFAGRIADTGINPMPLMKNIKKIISNHPRAKLLWASPREVLNIFQAEESMCDIITVPANILGKLDNINKNLNDFSLETVKMFYNDALKSGFKI
jgi:transaldolase